MSLVTLYRTFENLKKLWEARLSDLGGTVPVQTDTPTHKALVSGHRELTMASPNLGHSST